ncbi:ATP-binding protein [Streptomyces sp. SP18CS02]|uniref:ATP-binding protein n=1 Tax=Streptomyces sp. SP18CS02 TaxID=3002531 RepID=UPI002E76B78E|nr:ATP-binding protein [Streptomyces sp. SP18CS02]MEE1753585.1 ATP-binding protein [Streptomyces sp. SP18CS02]
MLPTRGREPAVIRRWSSGHRSVGRARAELRNALSGWELSRIEDDALLVLSELLTNALRHACVPGREIETRFAPVPGGLRIEVHDASETRPSMAVPGEDATGGRGLLLVDILARRWGVADGDGPGKLVWAELSTRERQLDGEEP